MNWNHPEAAAPWPTVIFLSYYMSDTTRENGCLRVIPGTHRKRIPLHDMLPDAHGHEIQAIDDLDHPIFMDHPDSVDVPLTSGDLIIADARLLHAAWPNQTAQRRTLVLAWHSVSLFHSRPAGGPATCQKPYETLILNSPVSARANQATTSNRMSGSVQSNTNTGPASMSGIPWADPEQFIQCALFFT